MNKKMAAALLGAAMILQLILWAAPREAHATTVIDVSTYGHDDAALQAAHDALPASGGELYFPAGAYELSDTVTISKPSVVLRGDGDDSKLYVKRTVNTFFAGLVVTGDAAQMRDLMLIGNGEADDLSITLKWQSDDSLVENCFFDRGGNRSMEIGYAENVMIRNNSFFNAVAPGYGYGIAVVNEAVNVVIRNNYFERHRHAISHGLYTTTDNSTPTNIYIVNNVIKQMPNGTANVHRAGINIHPNMTGTAYILDNEIYNATEDGLEITGMQGVIRNNDIHDNQRHGINIGADAVSWLVADNRVRHSGQAGLLVIDYPGYANNVKLDVLRSTFKNSALDDLYVNTGNTNIYMGGMTSPAFYDTATSQATSAFGRSRFTSFADSAIAVPDFGWPENKSTILEFRVKDSRPVNAGLQGYYLLQMLVDDTVVWEQDPLADGTDWTYVKTDVIRQIAGKKEFTVSFRAKLVGSVSNFGLNAYVDDVKLGDGALANGGFEQPGGWTYNETASSYWNGDRDGGVSYEGGYSYRLSFPDLQPASPVQYGEVKTTVQAYKSKLLTFYHKDNYAANAGLTGSYKAVVAVDGTPVWSLDPLTTGTSWSAYTVDIGKQIAWKPDYTLSLRGELNGTVWNFGMRLSWDDIRVDGEPIPNGGFEQAGGWNFRTSTGSYWTGGRSGSGAYEGSYAYETAFPESQYSDIASYGEAYRVVR